MPRGGRRSRPVSIANSYSMVRTEIFHVVSAENGGAGAETTTQISNVGTDGRAKSSVVVSGGGDDEIVLKQAR